MFLCYRTYFFKHYKGNKKNPYQLITFIIFNSKRGVLDSDNHVFSHFANPTLLNSVFK